MSTIGPMLVGVRFDCPPNFDLDKVLRVGSGPTFVIEAEPISGPIFFYHSTLSEDGAHVERTPGNPYCFAKCHGCNERSQKFKQGTINNPHMQRWAHAHRCEPTHGKIPS